MSGDVIRTVMIPTGKREAVERVEADLRGEAEGDVAGLMRAAPEDALRLWPLDNKGLGN